jgi:hypothetical protein
MLEEVAGGLTECSTELNATRVAMKTYRREGADRFFHLPVALFGDPTALPNPWKTPSLWPTIRALESGDSIILDALPAGPASSTPSERAALFRTWRAISPVHR